MVARFRDHVELPEIEILLGLLVRKCGGFTIAMYDKHRADTKDRTALKARRDVLVTQGTDASPPVDMAAAAQRAEEIRQLEQRLGELAVDISVSAGAVSSFGRLLRRVSERGIVFVPLEPVVPGGFIPLRLDRYVSRNAELRALTSTIITAGGNDHAAAKYVLHRVNPQELFASANAHLDVEALLRAKDREHKAALEAALLRKGRECNARQTKTMAGLSSSMAEVFNSEFPEFYHTCFVRALDKAHNGEGGGGGGGDNARDEDDDEHRHRDKRQRVVAENEQREQVQQEEEEEKGGGEGGGGGGNDDSGTDSDGIGR